MDFEEITKLYISGLSVPSIAKKLDCSPWTIYSLMKRNNFKRRAQQESNRINFYNKPLSYSIKKKLSDHESKLKIMGLMIYWAEGSKRGKNTVDLANSDILMVKIFLRFLRRTYRINEERLRVLLYCYSNQPVDALIKYWSKVCGISIKQFSKPYVRNDYAFQKTGRMPYGLVHIRYSDTRLLTQIKSDIEQLTNSMLG